MKKKVKKRATKKEIEELLEKNRRDFLEKERAAKGRINAEKKTFSPEQKNR